MAYYDYQCESCGPFTAIRPMSQSADKHDCPDCGQPSARAFFSMPYANGMDAARRTAFATNEKASHEPRRSHGAGCSCCSASKSKPSSTVHLPNGSKTFAGKRPWMISH
ncbi:MAG: zinc ribbon domain-containing protein [Candidatus Devosia phytovorans]|uniref:Zinc ribbon domain-containing protein n=1 Tax=Candidatus Devosia phytovorans TaxID=3121372 RepID=A0AAJ6B192_9HYPH|nr:zinc ribbon domain-containing protein [Devosia sp.]WEK06037.1 MAG: zinc ribbon domain-containing protein [Devosia sp.]